MTTIRELAQAVVDAWDAIPPSAGIDYLCAQQAFDDAERALCTRLGLEDVDVTTAARAILAALDAEREAPKWQPIETAPAGVWVLAWAARGTYGTAAPCVLVTRRDAWGWAEFDGGAVEPTHWQPLPAPPEVTAQREGAEGGE